MPAPIIAGYELDTKRKGVLDGYELDTRGPSSLDGYELDPSGPPSLDGYELEPKEAEMTPDGQPIYKEDNILTKAGWLHRKRTTDTDMVKGAVEAVKGLWNGFAKIPELVRAKGFDGASGNLPEAMLAAGEGWKDVLNAAASKVGSIGMSEEQDLDRQYQNYLEVAERSVEQVKRSRSRVGDFFRAIGAPEHAATMDESIDQDVANSLSMVLDPTNLIGGGSGKALMAAGKGEKVAVAAEKLLPAAEKASADIAERTAKTASAASDVPKTIAVDSTPLAKPGELASGFNPSPTPLSVAGKLTENTGKGLQSMASSLVEWERLNPGYAALGGAAVGAASSDDPLTGAFVGAGAGVGVPRLLKTVPAALRTAGEAAQVLAVAAKEGIDVAAKSGVAGEKVSAVAKRLDTPAANFLLTQSAKLADAVFNGAVIGGGLGYATGNDPEQSAVGSGIGAGIVGGGMGRLQSIGIDQAGRVSVHRPDSNGKWVRVSESPAALAKDYDLAVSFLASRSLPERTALAGRLNIAELAELARGEAAAKGASRITGSDMEVRFLDADAMVAAGFDPTVAKVMQGVTETDQKPVLFINLDVSSDPAMTLWHEAMHGFDRLAPDEVGGKQTDAGASLAQTRAELKAFYFGSFDRDGNRTAPGKYNEAQFLKLEDQYVSRTMSPAEIADHQKKSMSDRAAYIADEMAAEHAGMLGRLSGGDIGKASRYPSTALGRAALGVLARTRIGLESLGIVFDGGGDVVTSGVFKDPTTGKRLELSSDVREKLAAYLRAKDKITTRMSIDFDESPITEVANARDLSKAGTTPETLARWKDSGMFALDDKGEIRMQGGRPVFLTAAERKKVDANRSLAIFTAIKNAPDDGSPGLRSSVVDGVETFVGTKLGKAQIDAVLALPDAVLPPSVKDRISQLVKLQEEAGAPIMVDYNKAITGGRYDSKASISTQIFVPMSLSITAAGNFIVTSFSVVGFERKIATWKRTKKKFFEPWGGNMDSFRTDVEVYLNNQASGVGNKAEGAEAIAKKNAINDFLAAVLVGDMDRVSTKSNSDNLIRAFRVDRIQSIDRASGKNMPYDYRKVRANFQPADDEASAPFYSRLNRTVEQSQQNKASGAQWKATIKNSKLGANVDEMALVGIHDLEDGKTYTKQEVLDYLKANEVVVKDVTLGKTKGSSLAGVYQNAESGQWVVSTGGGTSEYPTLDLARRAAATHNSTADRAGETHFSTYQLPGAKEGSYREVLLTVPWKKVSGSEEASAKQWWAGKSDIPWGRLSDAQKRLAAVEAGNLPAPKSWNDGHSQYNSVANPVVRLRFNERTTADGKRMLFLEEVQAPQKDQFEKMPALFQKNWREIAFKWALRKASEEGYDSVGWTTGEQQAARYDLSKHIDQVAYHPNPDGTFNFVASRGSDTVMEKRHIPLTEVEASIGKELAAKMQSGEGTPHTNPNSQTKFLSGVDLKVGGEGLKKLYDSDFRNVVNGLPAVKKSGQKVGMVYFDGSGGKGLANDNEASAAAIGAKPVNSIALTPEIKGSVMGGQARFQPSDAESFTISKPDMTRFMPASDKVNLEDYADRKIIALAADRMGIGAMSVGPTGAKQQLSVQGQGGRGFMNIFNGGGWAFSDESTATRFISRLKQDADQDGNATVGITIQSPINHLKNQTGQLAYIEAMQAAIDSKTITKSAADAQIAAMSSAIVNSEDKTIKASAREKFSRINTLEELKSVVQGRGLNFADMDPLLTQMQRKKLPITGNELAEMGMTAADIARDLADPELADLPFGSVVALLGVNVNQAPIKTGFHHSYPWTVHGEAIGFLEKFYNIADLSTEQRIRNKSGAVTAQPLQTVMPVMDNIINTVKTQRGIESDPSMRFQPSDERGPKKRSTQAPPEVPEAAYGYWVTPDGKMLTTNDHIALAHQLLQRKVTLGELTQETYSRQLNNIYPLMAELGYLRVVRESPADYSFDGRNPSPSQRAILESFGVWREKNITHMTNGRGRLFYDADKPKARYQPADVDYLAAVKSGDMKAVQGMVDEAAKAAGGIKVTHFKARVGNKGFLNRSTWADFKLTEDERLELPDLLEYGLAQPRDVTGKFFFTEEGLKQHARLIELGKKISRPGVVREDGYLFGEPNWKSGDGQVAADPSQIKSADPVTRDSKGNVIPLSERFNTKSEDIRYQPKGDADAPRMADIEQRIEGLKLQERELMGRVRRLQDALRGVGQESEDQREVLQKAPVPAKAN